MHVTIMMQIGVGVVVTVFGLVFAFGDFVPSERYARKFKPDNITHVLIPSLNLIITFPLHCMGWCVSFLRRHIIVNCPLVLITV